MIRRIAGSFLHPQMMEASAPTIVASPTHDLLRALITATFLGDDRLVIAPKLQSGWECLIEPAILLFLLCMSPHWNFRPSGWDSCSDIGVKVVTEWDFTDRGLYKHLKYYGLATWGVWETDCKQDGDMSSHCSWQNRTSPMQTWQAYVKNLPCTAGQTDADIQHHIMHLFWSVSFLKMIQRAELGHCALDEQSSNCVRVNVCTGTPVLQVSLACRLKTILKWDHVLWLGLHLTTPYILKLPDMVFGSRYINTLSGFTNKNTLLQVLP